MPPSRAERLAQIRALRAAGKTGFDAYEVQEAESIYETVDDEAYKKVVRRRLEEDDFVVDDNGAGYADDGREDWQDEQQHFEASGSENDMPRSKNAKRKREEEAQRQEKLSKGINKYFQSKPVPAAATRPVRNDDDDAFLEGLLGEVDSNIPSRAPTYGKTVRLNDRRKTRVISPPPPVRTTWDESVMDTTPPTANIQPDDDPYYADDVPMSDPLPSSPAVKAVERKAKTEPDIKLEPVDDDDLMVGEVQKQATAASVSIKAGRPPPIIKKAELSSPPRAFDVDVDMSSVHNIADHLNLVSSPQVESSSAGIGKLSLPDTVEDDGSLRFFWTDYTEVNGSLCLFGKVKNRTTGDYVSTLVKVDNILRKLFFLPREYRHQHGRQTTEQVDMGGVYGEVDKLMTKFKVDMHKIKECTRKYAFELPGVPKEADYLKLLYPYTKPQLPVDLSGETFSQVFGTNTALFEQFVLWKNIMGPCWLQITGGNFTPMHNASWCKFEVQVQKPAAISVVGESEDAAPPLTLMSLALRTTMNVTENKNEILMASVRFFEGVSLTDTSPPEKMPQRTFTIMRPHGEYPIGFKMEAEKHRGQIRMERNEQALLSMLLAIIQKHDPDAIIGHRLDDVDLNILLTRMRDRKTPGWHRIGRLKRSDWPKNVGRGGGSFFAERQLAAGRLMCDLANDMGKSMMTACQSWSLDEMCTLYLGQRRQEIDAEKALAMASTREGLMNYVKLCEQDSFFIAALAIKRQLLPLTKVLTNLAGNSWARTLSGTRAERNEFILLHEFHRNKYICPDKMYGKASAPVVEDDEGDGAKKKDKYKGGLVFEPEKGLYDKFILVMDFNSLYPSIIQEYNICFTTVERSDIGDDDSKIPSVPTDTANKGILPRLIRTLVSRRREVKKLMKDKNATEDQRQTWDVKQQALKLTANSMYGCLGYTKSRFYARPLAALTTSKGREILQSTKDLAESAHALRVIYGDTDSVMVNTNVDNILEALKLGKEFQKAVNERYELLEIEIDNVFRRLLLHAKKKYAAINMTEVDGVWKEKMEVKGLDMRRREYCQLSKDTSTQLLNYLLSGEDPEKVVSQIHDHLRELAASMRANSIPAYKYTIYTQLGKAPHEYPNGGSMPSVQVALKLMAKGKQVKAKDVMSFVICGTSNGSAENAAKNAYPLGEVMAKDSELVPDIDYYLHKQILPPVERLCAPISGTNVTLLAECLGLDTSKYRVSDASKAAGQSNEITTLESQVPDHIRFKDCQSLQLLCLGCRQRFEYRGISNQEKEDGVARLTNSGLACPSCSKVMSTLTLSAQLEAQVRRHTTKYYTGWLVCDDPACGTRTRQMCVYGQRCLGPKGLAYGCSGRMTIEFSEKMLYNQLLFLQSMFDVEKATSRLGVVKMEESEKVKILAGMNRERFGVCWEVMQAYLDKSGWGWVSMDSLFGFALRR